MSIEFLVLGVGGFGVWGGGKCRFYSYGRGDFSEIVNHHGSKSVWHILSTMRSYHAKPASRNSLDNP